MRIFTLTFTIVLVFCLSNSVLAQKKMNLHFKDGTSQTGYVTFKKKEIKFQEKLKGKKEKVDYADIDSLSSYVNPRATRARAPKTVHVLATDKENKDFKVYDIVTKGKVTLYKYSSFGGYSAMWVPTGGTPGSSVYIPSGGGGKTITYAVKRDGESFVSVLGNSDSLIRDSFKTQGYDYFNDCPDLASKIKNKEKGFEKKDIKKIVTYYNSNCSGNE